MSPARFNELIASVDVLYDVQPGITDESRYALDWQPGDDTDVDAAIESVVVAAILLYHAAQGEEE